jgi:hypothetical protein
LFYEERQLDRHPKRLGRLWSGVEWSGVCGYETWSLTLREHRLRVYEYRLLRRIFGHKRENVVGG